MVKGANQTIKIEAKDQKGGFLSMLLGTLAASLLPTLLSSISKGKRVIRGCNRVIQTGEGNIRAGKGQDFWCCLIF